MKTIFGILILFIFLASNTFGAPAKVLSQNIKLPSQVVMETMSIIPEANGTNQILADSAGSTNAVAKTYSTFIAQPDVARNLVITPKGTTTDIENCNIVVNGTNFRNKVISETFTFLANATDAVVGSKAFKTVTSVVFPANCESGGFAATWSIGYGSKIGLSRCMNGYDVLFSLQGSTKETVSSNVTYHASSVELNTITPTTTLNGSNPFKFLFIQNYRCY